MSASPAPSAAAAARAAPTTAQAAAARACRRPRRADEDLPALRIGLIAAALAFLAAFVLVPTAAVLVEAMKDGLGLWWQSLGDPDALAAIWLTLAVAAIAVPLNVAFGLAAAWSVTRFRFPGKTLLVSLIDLPFGVSPVISGMATALLFGAHGYLGPWLTRHGMKVMFAVPGVVLATVLVTFPFVARELIPFMEAQGTEEEEAALVLGATGWQMFRSVTLPNVKWPLLYGVILCNARAMGEFGAVSVVSGHIRGMTNTIPLHVEILYNEYQFRAAFAVASLLLVLALVTLVAKRSLEWRRHASRREEARRSPA